MSIDSETEHNLNTLLKVWREQGTKLWNWHGIGLCPGANPLICYITPGTDESALLMAVSDLDFSIEVSALSPFVEVGTMLTSVSATGSHFSTLQSGRNISARSDSCNKGGCLGTIGAFLHSQPPQEAKVAWLLSANHILARARDCQPDRILDENADTISREIRSPRQSLDAAVARIDGVDLQSLRPLAKTPRIPDPGTRVMKVGRHITVGTVLCRCPVAKIGNCDDPLKKSEHSDLLMIESIPGEDPFLAGSDSGSLVTTEDGTPVGIATAANTESLESGSSETPCGLVTLITAIMPEMERILKDLSPPPLKISLKV